MSETRWEVRSGGLARAGGQLTSGWEPFAVVAGQLWVRRAVAEVSTSDESEEPSSDEAVFCIQQAMSKLRDMVGFAAPEVWPDHVKVALGTLDEALVALGAKDGS